MTTIKNCIECGKEFEVVHQRELKPGWRKYCSLKCAGRHISKVHRKIINERARQKLKDHPEEVRLKRAESARKWRVKNPEKSREIHRNRKDRLNGPTGEMATDDNIHIYGYKEPLQKFEGGYGYKGVISYNKDRDKVQCHFCGRLFRAINNGHLMKVHGLTAAEYKEKTGLIQTASLVGEGTREKLLNRPFNPNHMKVLKDAQKKRQELKKKGVNIGGRKWRLERHNIRGTCPDQLLDTIQKTITSFGRIPTHDEFVKFHHGRFITSIRNTFGGWTQALKKMNLETYKKRFSKEHLLESMRTFYEVHKRTPRWSDFNRGLLPDASAYYRMFKSMNHARLLAGVPIVINFPGRKSEEWSPSKLEKAAMLQKI